MMRRIPMSIKVGVIVGLVGGNEHLITKRGLRDG